MYKNKDMSVTKKPIENKNRAWKQVLNRDLVMLSVGCGILMGVQFAFTSYLVSYLENTFLIMAVSAPSLLAGNCYSLATGGGFIGRIGLGFVSDKVLGGKRKGLLVAVCLISGLILLLMAGGLYRLGMVALGLAILLYGMTGVSFTGLQLSMVSEMTEPSLAGSASGFSLTLGFAGMMIFPPIFGSLVDFTKNYEAGLFVLAIMTGLGILFILPIQEKASYKRKK